jgi:hypothetical protein
MKSRRSAALEAPFAPAVAGGLTGEKRTRVAGGKTTMQFTAGFLLVEQFEENQEGELLDVGDRDCSRHPRKGRS